LKRYLWSPNLWCSVVTVFVLWFYFQIVFGRTGSANGTKSLNLINPILSPISGTTTRGRAMGILALPLVISLLKPHATTRLCLSHSLLRRRHFATTVSATTTPHSPPPPPPSPSLSRHSSASTQSDNRSANPPTLTFQQAIQRLQVFALTESHYPSVFSFKFITKTVRWFNYFILYGKLQEYWASVGCSIMQCSNTEVVKLVCCIVTRQFGSIVL